MTASLSIAPVAAAKLAALRALVAREFGCSLRDIASLRAVRQVAEVVDVDVTSQVSGCCGHAPDREEGEDCGCQDVDVTLTVRVASAVKGGMPRDVTVSGDVTLASGRFDVQDWSWSQSFAERVRALGLRLDDAESAIEEAVEAAT
jgi:hypothetical protein